LDNFFDHSEKGITRGVSFFVIEKILQQPKLRSLSTQEKEEIRWAYGIAEHLHLRQKRMNGNMYIEHIDRSLELYINETLWKDEPCDLRYICGLMLHDCIEDNDEGLEIMVQHGMSSDLILDVLWMSKPTETVINQLNQLKINHPDIYEGFDKKRISELLEFHAMASALDPEIVLQLIRDNLHLLKHTGTALLEVWNIHFRDKFHNGHNNREKQHKLFADFMFLLMISKLPKELLRIKATERRDNIQDIEWLLNEKKVHAAKRIMNLTMVIYIPLLHAKKQYELAQQLQCDKQISHTKFVTKWLMYPELDLIWI
jgi:hypothetical protein